MKSIPAVVVLLACLLMSSACANSNKDGEQKDTAINVGQLQQTQQDAQEADKEPDKSSNNKNKKLYLYEGVNGERYFLSKQSDTKNGKLIREIPIYEGSLFYSGLVSKDNKKVAWVEGALSSNEEGVEGVTNIYVSDIDGQNQIKVVKNIHREEELQLVNFNNSSELYYGMSFSGLGGRCLYEYVEDLYKVNTTTGESEFIFGTTEETRRGYNNSEYITALSNKGDHVAYFQNNSLNVQDIHSGKKVSFPMPSYDDVLAYGSGLFSPDDKKIVFQMAIEGIKCEENDGYIIKHIVVDLENQSIKEICETPETESDPAVKWTANNMLEFTYEEKTVVIDLDNL